MNNRESYHTCIDILRETEQYNFDILYIITKKEHDKRQYIALSLIHIYETYSIDKLAEEVGEKKNQIYRYIRLTKLVEPLRDMVDGLREDKIKIAFNPAVELSYLSKENQELVVKYIEEFDLTPSHAQTIRMKELSKENRLDENVIYSIMTEVKANQKEKKMCIRDRIMGMHLCRLLI